MILRTIIADDEVLAREGLKLLLSSDPEVRVVAECFNGTDTVSALQDNESDLLFLDIQMPGLDGFEVIERIGIDQMPVTVFITAHDQYAVKAFEVEALDYLTKPVEPERLHKTLRRVKEYVAARVMPITHEQLRSVLTRLSKDEFLHEQYRTRFLVPNGAKDVVVNVTDIEWIEAESYYARIHVGPKSYLLRETIKHLALMLDPKRFVRIHRSTIVNIDRVNEIFRDGQIEGSVVLSNGRRLRMSKTGWQHLLEASRQ